MCNLRQCAYYVNGLSNKKNELFLPDQHLGRNTAHKLGIALEHMCIYNPIDNEFEFDGAWEDVDHSLKGHCSVHEITNI